MSKRDVIGIDLGGSSLRMAYVSRKGRRIGAVLSRPVEDRGFKSVLDLIVHSIRHLRSERPDPLAIGIGLPGFIHRQKAILYRSPNFPEWRNVPIGKLLRAHLRVPIIIENDANAAAFGEAWVGRGRGAASLVYLGLGTGVGGGIILDGQVWNGMKGLAAELGHITINPEGPVCACGRRGCLESYSSATAVIRRYREMKPRGGTAGLTAHHIALRARKGDRKAQMVFEKFGWALGIGISDLLNIFDPERIIIGGGVLEAWPLFRSKMMAEIRERAIHPSNLGSKILRCGLKNESGLIGAAGLAYQGLGLKLYA